MIDLPLIDKSNAMLEDKNLKKNTQKKVDYNFAFKALFRLPSNLEDIAVECTKPRSTLFERGRLSDSGTPPPQP